MPLDECPPYPRLQYQYGNDYAEIHVNAGFDDHDEDVSPNLCVQYTAGGKPVRVLIKRINKKRGTITLDVYQLTNLLACVTAIAQEDDEDEDVA